MQMVWNRVAQTRRTCRCISCTVTTTVARRTTSAAATTSSRAAFNRYLTTSTLLYSGIFAVAATTDALFKEQRRQQWATAIEDTKQRIQSAQSNIDAAEAALMGRGLREEIEMHAENGVELLASNGWQGEVDQYLDKMAQQAPEGQMEEVMMRVNEGIEPDDYIDQSVAAFEAGSIRRDSSSVWPENSGRSFNQAVLGPESVFASEGFTGMHGEKKWTAKKLHLMSLSVDRMAVRMLLHVKLSRHATELDPSFTPRFLRVWKGNRTSYRKLLEELDSRIRAVKATPADGDSKLLKRAPTTLTNYSHEQGDQMPHKQVSIVLQHAVEDTFRKYQTGLLSKNSAILRIVNDMTRSSAPPNLHTWNMIIKELCAGDFHKNLTPPVLRAMRVGHMRVNEETLVNVLKYCMRTNDYDRFYHWIELINGERGGLSLARPDVEISKKSDSRLSRVVRFGKDKVVQRPVANPLVFDAVVQGVLHFDGLEAAFACCKANGLQGWGLSMRGLTPILRACAEQGAWQTGSAVWTQILRLRDKSRSGSHRGLLAEVVQPWTWATMLRLCIACGEQRAFESVLAQARAEATHDERQLLLRVKALGEKEMCQPQREVDRKRMTDALVARRPSISAGDHTASGTVADASVGASRLPGAERSRQTVPDGGALHRAYDTVGSMATIPCEEPDTELTARDVTHLSSMLDRKDPNQVASRNSAARKRMHTIMADTSQLAFRSRLVGHH